MEKDLEKANKYLSIKINNAISRIASLKRTSENAPTELGKEAARKCLLEEQDFLNKLYELKSKK